MDVEQLHHRAREAWSGIDVPLARFALFLDERADSALTDARAVELYLVCACADGDARAVHRFEAAYFGEVRAAMARVTNELAITDEALQRLRERLFVCAAGAADRPRGIASYAGRGDLRGWLRVAATRAALELLRARRPAEPADALDQITDDAADPELALMRRQYGSAASAAVAAAFAELEPRERNLLRQYFVDGLTIDALGKLYAIHRATAARWVERARAALEKRTRAQLRERLGAGHSTIDSIVRMVQSDLHTTLSGLWSEPSATS